MPGKRPDPLLIVSQKVLTYRLNCADDRPADTPHGRLMRAVALEQMSVGAAIEENCARHGVRIDERPRRPISDWDDYLIPGTSTLKNKLVEPGSPDGVTDPNRFRIIEQEISHLRMVDLAIDPVAGDLDYDHSKEIHRRIFQDIYSWAGQERIGPSTPMVRFAPDAVNFEAGDPAAPYIPYAYSAGPDIAEAASAQFLGLAALINRTDLTREELVDLSAEFGSEINAIHPFRDGNLRAFGVWVFQFHDATGYPVNPGDFIAGTPGRIRSEHAHLRYQATSRHHTMAGILDETMAIDPQPRVPTADRTTQA